MPIRKMLFTCNDDGMKRYALPPRMFPSVRWCGLRYFGELKFKLLADCFCLSPFYARLWWRSHCTCYSPRIGMVIHFHRIQQIYYLYTLEHRLKNVVSGSETRMVDADESVCQGTLNSIENPSCHATFSVSILVIYRFRFRWSESRYLQT